MTIRKFRPEDAAQVRNICLVNAQVDFNNKPLCDFILTMFCNYYIEKEPQNCFVATDEDDVPYGYVYGAADYDGYEKVFTELYLPLVLAISKERYDEALVEMEDHKIYKDEYPSHLHIDVLPGHQSSGTGSALITAYCDNLRNNGSHGVCLICGEDNYGAQRFYKIIGFTMLHLKDTGAAMGKKL